MSCIYAFRDNRYDYGVKIGWDKNDIKRIEMAQSYSPVGIFYEAAWEVTGTSTGKEYEKQACLGLKQLVYPNNGREWYDVDVQSCISQVSQNLGIEPKLKPWDKISKWDDFRSPRGLNSTWMYKYKQVLWVYEEHQTRRVKVQRIADWKTPLETVKTYSRNGFYPVFAATYKGAATYDCNIMIHQTWEAVLTQFGAPTDNSTFGWLPDGVSAADVIRYLENTRLDVLRSPFTNMPEGVKPSYN